MGRGVDAEEDYHYSAIEMLLLMITMDSEPER